MKYKMELEALEILIQCAQIQAYQADDVVVGGIVLALKSESELSSVVYRAIQRHKSPAARALIGQMEMADAHRAEVKRLTLSAAALAASEYLPAPFDA